MDIDDLEFPRSTSKPVYTDSHGEIITTAEWQEIQHQKDLAEFENEIWLPRKRVESQSIYRSKQTQFCCHNEKIVHRQCWLLWSVRPLVDDEPVSEIILGIGSAGWEEIDLECPFCGHSETVKAGTELFSEARRLRDGCVNELRKSVANGEGDFWGDEIGPGEYAFDQYGP